ncbi:MAG TPA: fibronectin type III domain-containing protein [Thermoanaerobaculia bacterium]|nr:fibronectin type III domain-containing protein [Thermoanaerobaculia bacterium]
MRQRLTRILPALFWFLLVASGAEAATVTVSAIGSSFEPQTVNINVGDTVFWTGLANGHNVDANDDSFRSGNIGAVSTFSHTFDSAGAFGYRCEAHFLLGMAGTVNVSDDGGGGEQPGTLQLTGTAFNVFEGESTNLQVLRIGGDDGAVSVSWSVTALTAQASDFTAASGTLSWADGDDDPKIVTVATTEDAAAEGNETVRVTLSNPAGGAALNNDARIATVTIQDDDAGGSAPSAPANLAAHSHSTTEVMLTWTDSSGETGYRIERKTLGGAFVEVATAPGNSTSTIVGGLQEATRYTFRIRAQSGSGVSGYSNEASAVTPATPSVCVESATTLCLNNNRFQVEVDWRAPGNPATAATAIPLEFAPESGLFYFSNPGNIEMLVKVLNACDPVLGNKYWVFYAATTNVEFSLTVIDTQTGAVQVYENPANNPAAPVQDTNAFATCP